MNKNQLSWWEYDEQQVAGHERAVQLLESLAKSSGVVVREDDKLRWRTMLGVFRCLDDAIDSTEDLETFDTDTFEQYLKTGRGINGRLSPSVALGFRALYSALPSATLDISSRGARTHTANAMFEQQRDYMIDGINKGKERREMGNIVISLLSFARDALEARTINEYRVALDKEAAYKGALLQIRRSSGEALTVAENTFNTWLVNFYRAYSSVDTVVDLHLDHKNGETRVEPSPWPYLYLAATALQATYRVYRAAPPAARQDLVWASVSRVSEKFGFSQRNVQRSS